MYIPEIQGHQDEIRTGLWEAGEFVEVCIHGGGGADMVEKRAKRPFFSTSMAASALLRIYALGGTSTVDNAENCCFLTGVTTDGTLA